MLVKDIIKKVANYTNNFELYEALNNNVITEQQQKEINLLVDCVNLTNTNIATNYVKIIATKEISNASGFLSFSKISDSIIYDILSVKNKKGEALKYTIVNNGINTSKGMIIVKYSYFPDNIAINDEINSYQTKISERCFVYGVVAEYLYVKGVFDEALIWEDKFKYEMKNVVRNQRNIKLKKRGWY